VTLRKFQNTLAAIVVVAATVALLFESKIEEWWQHRDLKTDRRPIIGHIESIHGDAKFRRPESLTAITAVPGMNLHSDDTVFTDNEQSVIISFNSGLKVELEPHSEVVITDLGQEMIFLKGHVKILNEVPGITLPPEALNKEEAKADKPQAPSPETPPLLTSEKAKVPSSKITNHPKKVNEKITLPDAYISAVIKNQRTFLNRCYAQHLRMDPDSQGRIETSLTIESDGNVSTARVIGSSIADPQLQQCIVSTLQRAKFKAFAGDPIIVTYPINLD